MISRYSRRKYAQYGCPNAENIDSRDGATARQRHDLRRGSLESNIIAAAYGAAIMRASFDDAAMLIGSIKSCENTAMMMRSRRNSSITRPFILKWRYHAYHRLFDARMLRDICGASGNRTATPF